MKTSVLKTMACKVYAATSVYSDYYTLYHVNPRDAAWNAQLYVQRWLRVRKPVTVLATICNLAIATYISCKKNSLADSTFSNQLVLAALALSTLAECVSRGGTVWFTQVPHPIANWPLFAWLAPMSRWCDTHRHAQWIGDVVLFVCLGACVIAPQVSALVVFTWLWLIATSVVDGVRFFIVMQPWLVCMGAFAFGANPVIAMRLVCGGTYFFSGVTKLFNRAYYTDTAPVFFAPVTRALHTHQSQGTTLAVYIEHILYASGVACEALLGATLLLLALTSVHVSSVWIMAMRLVTVGLHLYIICMVRLWHLPNWNSLCMVLGSIALDNSTAGGNDETFSLYTLGLVAIFCVWPLLAFTGHGFGYMSHHYFCGGYEGDCGLVVRKDEIQGTHIMEHLHERAHATRQDGRLDEQPDGVDLYRTFLNRLTMPQQVTVLDRLHIPHSAHVAPLDVLLKHTLLLDSSFYERHLSLTRPMWNEVFLCDLQVYHVWFWRFFNRTLVKTSHSLLVVTRHWTWRGYENHLIDVNSKL
jgi:hypothetical protein